MRFTGDGQSKPVISDTFRTGGCKSNHFDGPASPAPARPSLFLLVRNHGGHENVAPLTIDDLVCAFDIAYPTLDGHRRGLQICAPQAVHDIIPRGAPGRRRRRRLPPGRPFQHAPGTGRAAPAPASRFDPIPKSMPNGLPDDDGTRAGKIVRKGKKLRSREGRGRERGGN